MKNKLFKGLSLSANPKHLIKGVFFAAQRVFAEFGVKNHTFGNNKFSSYSIKGSGLLRVARNDVCSVGRSMIEMLGVLAIIAILTVGGIAGYSKAMEKFKLNKAISEYSMLIFGMQDYIESIQKYTIDEPHIGAVQIAEAANLIPQAWEIQSNYGLLDVYGNRLQIYIDKSPRHLIIDFYLQGMTKAETNQYTQTFSGKLCMELFNNIIIPLNNTIYEAHIFRSKSGNGKNFSGKTSCSSNKTCIKDMTLNDVHNACNYCTAEDNCAIVLVF